MKKKSVNKGSCQTSFIFPEAFCPSILSSFLTITFEWVITSFEAIVTIGCNLFAQIFMKMGVSWCDTCQTVPLFMIQTK